MTDDNNNKHTSSKIISIQSTSDGDIQTVTEETTTTGEQSNLQISPIRDESVRAFKNHLRDSWDEVVDVPSRTTATTVAGDDSNNGKEGTTSGVEVEEGTKEKKKTRHKQNLSVQFLDFNISEDSNVTNFTLSGINNNNNADVGSSERRKKETITGSFRFGETSQVSTTTTTTKVEHNKDTTASSTATLSQSQNDMTNFTNNLQNSWNETTTEDVKDGNKASFVHVKQVSNHKPNYNQSVQFLDSTIMEYSNDMPVTNNKQSNDTATKDKKDISSQMSSRESVQQPPQLQPPPSERERLGSDSPISPYSSEKNDIVVPIPLRSNAPNSSSAGSGMGGGGGVNRKHRRVFSGRSNPAMSHRRVNTRGDKHAPAREFKFDGGLVGSDEGEQQQQQQQQKKKAFNAPTSEQLLSPASQAMPPPIPTQQIAMGQPQGGPQHYPPPPPPMVPPHPSYYHGTPPPSYDPYNVYGQHPPGAYYNASPQSDAGVNYNTNRASPVVSTAGQHAPLSQGYPLQQHQQQQAFHNLNTPLSTQSAPDGCYTFTERDVSMSSSNSQPPNLEQPLLDNNNNTTSRQKAELKIHTDEKLFGNSSTNDQGKQQHRKDPSLNPLPFNDSGHHRKQSSLGSFLATAELFDDGNNNNDDSGIYYEKEGYASAPEEGDSNKRTHNKTLSSASFMRSLSSDDFLRQMNDEEAKESSAAVKIPQQQQRPQQQVPPQHPHPSYPPPPMHSSSPVMSYPPQAYHHPHPPTPPGSMPRYPTPPGSLTGYPTPPGSVTGYPTPPGSHTGTPPNYYAYGPPPPYGTPPQSMMWQQHQYPPPQDQRASPNLPMHYSPDPQASMQFHQQPPQPYQQVPPPPHMPSRGPADIQNGPPLLQQSMICQPAPKGKQTDTQQKRSRRKCTVPDCPNRVVQGGLCITHGAKRKICSHPGCTKNVKKLGLCSAHGPARKKCEFEGCVKVAVQGGRCIAHGAKKKLCSFEECKKQAILGGMCKKHYDAVNGVVKQKKKATPKQKQPPSQSGGGHQRGLSIFQDSNVVDRIINNTTPPADNDGLHGLNI